jgi:hypothetical protein
MRLFLVTDRGTTAGKIDKRALRPAYLAESKLA